MCMRTYVCVCARMHRQEKLKRNRTITTHAKQFFTLVGRTEMEDPDIWQTLFYSLLALDSTHSGAYSMMYKTIHAIQH